MSARDVRLLVAHVVYRFDVGGLENGVVNLLNRLPSERFRHARAQVPNDLMMTSAQAAELRRSGFTLGAHTVSHPILAKADPDRARREIVESRARVAELAGEAVTLFAYPNGRPDVDYNSATAQMVRELGFSAAVSTSMGVATARSDAFQIPRFTPWDSRPLRFAAQLLSNMSRVTPSYAS